MTLILSGDITLRRTWQPMDPDAAAYITAVETADGQALEEPVKIAIDNFVLGCKADGIWDAIKASCILAGAKTKEGAFIDLKTATQILTNNGFVDGDYNRKTGLIGTSANTKYLNSNRNNNQDPQNNRSMSVWVSSANTLRGNNRIIGCGDSTGGDSYIVSGVTAAPNYNFGSSSASANYYSNFVDTTTGFIGHTRSSSTQITVRVSNTDVTVNQSSSTPRNENIGVFGRVTRDSLDANARLAFYSIGEALDLALLDTRVTDLINKFAEVIP